MSETYIREKTLFNPCTREQQRLCAAPLRRRQEAHHAAKVNAQPVESYSQQQPQPAASSPLSQPKGAVDGAAKEATEPKTRVQASAETPPEEVRNEEQTFPETQRAAPLSLVVLPAPARLPLQRTPLCVCERWCEVHCCLSAQKKRRNCPMQSVRRQCIGCCQIRTPESADSALRVVFAGGCGASSFLTIQKPRGDVTSDIIKLFLAFLHQYQQAQSLSLFSSLPLPLFSPFDAYLIATLDS